MFMAIKEMIKNQRVDPLVSNPSVKKMERANKVFRTQERRRINIEWYRVPTTELVMKVLLAEHVSEKRHLRDVTTPRKYLVDKSFLLPLFIGGLERAVNV